MRIPRARECMTAAAATCRPESDLERAAHLMWTNDCGVLPVVDEADHVVGIVTDRDLAIGAYTQGGALRDLPVSRCMSRDVLCCGAADSIEDVIHALGQRRVRRVPVVDESGALLGVLSLNDLVRRVAALEESPMRSRLEAEILSAMAAICEPHLSPEPSQRTAPAAPATRAPREPRAVRAR